MHDAIEVTTLFEDTVVSVRYLTDPRGGRFRPPHDFTIGTAPGVAQPAPCAGRFPLVRSTGADWELCFAREFAGSAELGGVERSLAELIADGAARTEGEHYVVAIPPGARIVATLGLSTFFIRRVEAPKRERWKFAIDWRAHASTAVSAIVAGLFLLLVNAIPPDPRSLALGELLDNPRFATWLVKPPAEEKVPAWLTPTVGASSGGDAGKRAAGDAGRMGRPGAQKEPRRFSLKGPANNPDPALAKRVAADQASRSVMIGLLRSRDASWIGSVFPRDSALGKDAETAFGGLRGTQTGEQDGAGGLWWIGNGPGGGGIGENTVGIGPWGQIGHMGLRPGAGPPRRAFALHDRGVGGTAIEPVLGPTRVIGNLDRELVRRVVRAHMQEVRFCYERELERHPELGGRVSAQFTISAAGQVLSSAIASSSMGSLPVESCVAQAVRRWQFPKPEGGGIVIVSYPFVFQRAGAQ